MKLTTKNKPDKKGEKMKKPTWYFTFGTGQKHAGKYVKIVGTAQEAREKMFEVFGRNWSWQYSQKQWDNPKKENILFQKMNVESKLNLAQVWDWKELKVKRRNEILNQKG